MTGFEPQMDYNLCGLGFRILLLLCMEFESQMDYNLCGLGFRTLLLLCTSSLGMVAILVIVAVFAVG